MTYKSSNGSSYTISHHVDVAQMLGGEKTFQKYLPPAGQPWIHEIRHGFPYKSVDFLKLHMHLTLSEIAQMLNISISTLSRRRKSSLLSKIESDRLYTVAKICSLAISCFNSIEYARSWIKKPFTNFNSQAPIELICFYPGSNAIEEYLYKWKHSNLKNTNS